MQHLVNDQAIEKLLSKTISVSMIASTVEHIKKTVCSSALIVMLRWMKNSDGTIYNMANGIRRNSSFSDLMKTSHSHFIK
jgi:hypothetical protein